MKAVAILWIFLNHTIENIFGGPYFANPSAQWPALADRINQLAPLRGYGLLDIPLNLARYLGWLGDQGVQLFLIVSGFVLTWSLLSRAGSKPLALGAFYRRRLGRIYPLWILAHIVFVVAALFISSFNFQVSSASFWLSLAGLRLRTQDIYYFVPAWWYFTLILQLYLVYPLLWQLLQRWGPRRLFIVACVVSFAVRGVGLLVLHDYLDAWSRGAIFITRLPEFVFGICVAAWLYQHPAEAERFLRSRRAFWLAIGLYVAGNLLSFTLPGMTVAPFLTGVGLFIPLYQLFAPRSSRSTIWTWTGEHSYALYLVHHPLILLLVPFGFPPASPARALIGIAAALILSFIGAYGLERVDAWIEGVVGGWYKRGGLLRVALYAGGIAAVVLALALGAELAVRRFDPQEVQGWGERASLVPDDTVGWHLKPSSVTRLRWQSYDYTVTANALGFPGPDYPEAKTPGTLRIMVLGDAFSSAEGVDTDKAWPRLMEAKLKDSGQKVEVMNFAITGYGPNQNAAVVRTYAPRYQPDIILVEAFVNDFGDTLISDDQFRQFIGFDAESPDGIKSMLRLDQLRAWLKLNVSEQARELLTNKPGQTGYALGNFSAFERNGPPILEGKDRMREKLSEIQAVAQSIHARVMVVMVPASIQVCQPGQLPYFPRGVNLSDTNQFDMEWPQQTMQALTGELGWQYYDLRPVLSQPDNGCLYQPHNMHWLPAGHQAVADYVAGLVSKPAS
jgi:peptidoglycan/LPS O-acetylase OafA/YrhL